MALSDVLSNLNKMVEKTDKMVKKAIYEVSADLLRESNIICPKNKGNLRKSGQVRVEKSGGEYVGKVSYGDARTIYAIKVHEIRAKNYTEPGTGWKYLENPLKEKSAIYQKHIADAVGRAIK